ncbi:hypothetical protein M5K25_003098 [Dendrobium thyrsiflorum]|uniref:At2g23090-like zinc-binding domain-containing protein n=1 Tax=Dendrobium thyrsiflorum TaxID=117978 RepID=A0ABD0VVH8_DENTH
MGSGHVRRMEEKWEFHPRYMGETWRDHYIRYIGGGRSCWGGGDPRCKICMQTFMCTTSESKCKEHFEAKHPKNELSQCFPHLK